MGSDELREKIARYVVQRVADMDDRTSPDDWPEAMLVTGEELHAIVSDALSLLPSRNDVLEERARIHALESLRDTIANMTPGGDADDSAEALDRLIALAQSIFPASPAAGQRP